MLKRLEALEAEGTQNTHEALVAVGAAMEWRKALKRGKALKDLKPGSRPWCHGTITDA